MLFRSLHAAAFTLAAAALTVLGFIHSAGATRLHFNALALGYAMMAAVFLAVHLNLHLTQAPALTKEADPGDPEAPPEDP